MAHLGYNNWSPGERLQNSKWQNFEDGDKREGKEREKDSSERVKMN